MIEGITTRMKVCSSPAPSIRAASIISVGTPLIAAERITMAKPAWSQIMTTIKARVLVGISCSQGIGSPPNEVTMALRTPI